MSLIWMRNPDRSVTADEPRFWTLGGGSLHADVTVTASGYDGTKGWTASSQEAPGIKFPRYVYDDRAFAIGCRIKLIDPPSIETILLGVVDTAGNLQACVAVTTDRTLKLYRGNTAADLSGESSIVLEEDVWYKLGLKGLLDHSNGELECHIDGEPLDGLRINNENTAEESDPIWRGIHVGFSDEWIIGHLYAIDGSGSQTDLIPGAYVKALGPDATVASGWSPLGAASVHQAIDEMDPDDSTTRIISPAVIGTRYLVSMSALSDTEAVYGAQLSAMVRNIPSSGLSASHELVAVVDGNAVVDTWQSVVQENWRVLTKMYETNPETEELWAVDEINDTAWGGQLQA